MTPDQRPPETLPDPWLFDSEALLRELARCRKLVINVPIPDLEATHFGLNRAVNALWDLEQTLRYLLHLHREGQRQWQSRTDKALSDCQKPNPGHQAGARTANASRGH